MQVIILCGGLATRIRPLSEKTPKSLILIEGHPFLEYQINLLKSYGFHDIVFCIGYKGNLIKKYFGDGKSFSVNIKYSEETDQLLGTGGSIKNAEDILKKEFMVMYGDSYLPFDFNKAINFFHKHHKLGLMTVYKNNNSIEPSNVSIIKNLVKKYNKKNTSSEFQYIDYGVSIFKKQVLNNFPNKRFDLSEIHQFLIKEKELLAYQIKERFYQIGDFQGLEEFKKYIKNKI